MASAVCLFFSFAVYGVVLDCDALRKHGLRFMDDVVECAEEIISGVPWLS
jgi:hypothetical protein